MRLGSKDTLLAINSRVCNNEPLNMLSIESVAQNNPDTRYHEVNITFQRLCSSERSVFDTTDF